MKKIINLFTILFVISIFTGCVRKAEGRKPIKIGICVWPGYAHAFIAKEKEFFKKNKVTVELIFKKDISEIEELYRNGEVDGLFDVFTNIIMINAEGIPTKTIYVVDYSDTGDVIIGRPEFNLLSDLKDKTIGCEGINTFSQMFILKTLETAGLGEGDVRFRLVPAMQVLKALEERQIDAGHTWEPIKSQAIEKGYKILAKAGDIPGLITDVLAFNAEIIEERPDDIKAIIKSLFEARDFVYSNKEEALEIMSGFEGMSVEEMESGIKGINHPDLKGNIEAMKKTEKTTSLYTSGEMIIDFYLNRGQLLHIPDLDELIEPKFVNELYKEEYQ